MRKLNTSVLLTIYNRPDLTAQVFNVIRQCKPPRLYIASDGAVDSSDYKNVIKCREIAKKIDWHCKVKTLFRKKNLGCKHSVSQALNWFFSHEESGIILEDDTLPAISFFEFCEKMLKKFKKDKSIWAINGFNPKNPGVSSSNFFLSQCPHFWGWASWRDRLKSYDINMLSYNSNEKIKFKRKVPSYVHSYYRDCFEKTSQNKIDTWDYQLTWLILKNSGFVIKPYANLISNIGVIGTRSVSLQKNHLVKLGNIDMSKCNFKNKKLNLGQDFYLYENSFKPKNFNYFLGKIKKFI